MERMRKNATTMLHHVFNLQRTRSIRMTELHKRATEASGSLTVVMARSHRLRRSYGGCCFHTSTQTRTSELLLTLVVLLLLLMLL